MAQEQSRPSGHIRQIITATESSEGAGATVKRCFPTVGLMNVDPFVLLDEFFVRPPAAFPEHSHGGFEILTYMLEGAFHHIDNLGNDRVIGAGALQKITAARGIQHAELPGSTGMNHGLQLWINLPQSKKEMNPEYLDFSETEIPEVMKSGMQERILVGPGSPISLQTQISYSDITLDPGTELTRYIPEGWNGLLYVISGQLKNPDLRPGTLEIFTNQVGVTAEGKCRFALLAGKPWGEQIQQRGGFVF